MTRFVGTRGSGAILAAVLAFSLASPACAKQKNKKKKSSDQSSQSNPVPLPPQPDSEQINTDIGQMLAAFQLGDVDEMHKYYADNATFVSGVWEPPVAGWVNYAPLFKRQWTAYQSIQLIRKNTYVYTHGDAAWAAYQWEFDAMSNGQPFQARGQTTLVFNKVGDKWLIVHNHTSEICQQCPVAPPMSRTPAANAP
ncbi:MAG: nuclear transport factor 2 family protein, partial [Acidobacteriota bacterium]|nr:nuclear transport factor 2 family protein [Acidobacteriota bacterium]